MQFYIDVAIGVAGTLVVQKSWSVLSGFFSTAETDAAAVATKRAVRSDRRSGRRDRRRQRREEALMIWFVLGPFIGPAIAWRVMMSGFDPGWAASFGSGESIGPKS